MSAYYVTLAYDVRCYCDFEVEADSAEEAEAKARAQSDVASFEPDWQTSGDIELVDVDEKTAT